MDACADQDLYTVLGTYDYIPTDIEALKEGRCSNLQANFIFVVRTTDAVDILRWYVLCALEKDCMAPPGSQLRCSFGHGRYKVYANCHRYDQSVINLLLANAHGCDKSKYLSSHGGQGAAIVRAPIANLTERNFTCTPSVD
ncbi:hypothetical protein OESDEN_06435 [Oesophagostomum dentatum]|uniref:Uncharacterized protein n=1 Tax=Oesophagostomum dentatum TaxID=61180 RepID=A0A0B1T803_OESDE|nr:hypothetical protein OESDEN_06435 [Oesophagostomum dentatum]